MKSYSTVLAGSILALSGPLVPTATAAEPSSISASSSNASATLKKKDTVAIVGNGLADRMQHHGWTEALIQLGLKDHQLSFRNLSLSGDRPNDRPRSKGFTPEEDYLKQVKADVIFCFFGYNESFDTKPSAYQADLIKMVERYKKLKPNGSSEPRIVLFSPTAFENLNDKNLPSGRVHNEKLLAITEATKKAAQAAKVGFVDLYHPTLELLQSSNDKLTINGVHFSAGRRYRD